MYSVEDPGILASIESNVNQGGLVLGKKFPGVGAQVLGVNDEYLCQHKSNVANFWGSKSLLPK